MYDADPKSYSQQALPTPSKQELTPEQELDPKQN